MPKISASSHRHRRSARRGGASIIYANSQKVSVILKFEPNAIVTANMGSPKGAQ